MMSCVCVTDVAGPPGSFATVMVSNPLDGNMQQQDGSGNASANAGAANGGETHQRVPTLEQGKARGSKTALVAGCSVRVMREHFWYWILWKQASEQMLLDDAMRACKGSSGMCRTISQWSGILARRV